MAAESQTVKAIEHEVAELDHSPAVEPNRREVGGWLGQWLAASAGGAPPDLPGILASADSGTRVRLVDELQRGHGNAHVQRLLATPSPGPAVTSAGGATGSVPAPAVGRRSGVPDAAKADMVWQVERLAGENRGRVLPMSPSQVNFVLKLVDVYVEAGKKAHRRGATDRPSAYVDRFVEACLIKAYDRGVFITDYSNVWDDILENASDEQAAELRGLLGSVASQYATYTPTADPDAASFWNDVGDPVVFRAFQLMSFGIVDKELFAEGDRAAMSGDYSGFAGMIGLRTGRAVLDVFTLGAGSAYLEGCWRFAEDHPEASYDSVAYAGMVSAWDAVVPTQEFFTIYNAARGEPSQPGGVPPDKWQAMEAFFAGALKVIGLVASAKGARAKAKKMGTKSPTADDLHGQATKSAEADVKGGLKDTAGTVRPTPTLGNAVKRIQQVIADGGWKKVVERARESELAEMEQARVLIQQKLGGVRTGRSGAGSDMDVTVRTYADAHVWMQRAARELFDIDLNALEPKQRADVIQRVHEALDVNLATDAGLVMFFESPALSGRAATRVEAAGMRAENLFELRILKGMAQKGNPEAVSDLAVKARRAGVDPAQVEPLRRVPEHEMTAEHRTRLEGLRREVDWYSTKGRLNETEARRVVELQTELLAYDPEAYFRAGSVKGEVGMRTPDAAMVVSPKGPLTPDQALGNIRNNQLNAINQLTEGRPRGTNPYTHAGGQPSFAKYVWRVLRTANLMGEKVDVRLLEQSQRLYKGKTQQISQELPDAPTRKQFAEDCIKEVKRVEAAVTARLKAADVGQMRRTLAALAGARSDDDIDLFGTVEADVIEAAARPASAPSRAATPAPLLGRDFGGEREATAGTGGGGIVVDERTRDYEARALPEIYLRQRSEIKQQILSRIREEGQRTLDVNTEGATTPATAWWDCLLNADADDYFDPQAGIMITPKEPAVDREGAIVEIDNFLAVEPAFPSFVGLYRAGMSDYLTGRTRSLTGAGRR